jgi:hypothetical protein
MLPPIDDSLTPTLSVTPPEVPACEAPVVRVIAPEEPCDARPVSIETSPLLPPEPPAADWIDTEPLDAVALRPLFNVKEPPAPPFDEPAVIFKSPPPAVDPEACPAEILMLPDVVASNPEVSPATRIMEPAFVPAPAEN